MMRTKNKGFTLAELMIVLGVIGIIAIILLTLLKGVQPNKDKTFYLKTYMRLSTMVSTLVNDTTAYPSTNSNEQLQYSYGEYPFYNTYVDKDKKYAKKWGLTASGDHPSKLCRLIAEKGYHVKNVSCDDTNYEQIPEYASNMTPAFSTKDGVDFYMYTAKTAPKMDDTSKGGYVASYRTVVYADTNGKEKGNNCLYNSATCKEPDVYRFLITADGKMYPEDAMGIYYTKTQKNTSKENITSETTQDKISALLTDDQRAEQENDRATILLRPQSSTNFGNVDDLPDSSDPNSSNDEIIIDGYGGGTPNQGTTACTLPDPDLPHCASYETSSTSSYYCPCASCRSPYELKNGICVSDNEIICTDSYCRYDCTTSYITLHSGYGSYTEEGGCQDGTALMFLEEKQAPYEEALKDCEAQGRRLPTTHELSAAAKYAEQMNLSTGNYWGNPLGYTDTREWYYGWTRNCYMPTGNCGVHDPTEAQYYRCVEK